MSVPTTGPVLLRAQHKLSKYVNLNWNYAPCNQVIAAIFKIYRLEGAEKSGKVIVCDGRLIATVSNNSFTDVFGIHETGVYSYSIVAVAGDKESNPTEGKAILI